MAGISIESGAGKIEFGVMSLPNRKSKMLYRSYGSEVDILAYFRSDRDAEKFEEVLNFIVKNVGPNLKRGNEK